MMPDVLDNADPIAVTTIGSPNAHLRLSNHFCNIIKCIREDIAISHGMGLSFGQKRRSQVSKKPVANSNTMNITGSQVGNVAQVSGSDGSTINQSTTSNDIKSIHEAIDRLSPR